MTSFAYNRPLATVTSSFIPATIAFTAGIFWSRIAIVPVSICWIIIAVLATRIIISLRQPSRWASPVMLLALFFILGGVHATSNNHPPPGKNHIYNQISSSTEASIVGRLIKSPQSANGKTYFLVNTEQLINQGGSKPVNGLVRLAMPAPSTTDLLPGDYIIARAKLSHVSSYGVPGAFGYKAYLNQKNIWVSGWISTPLLLKKISKKQMGQLTFLAK